MSLQIIYGRAGSGKTLSCLNVVEKIIKDEATKIIYIVPEQYSLQTERKILECFSDIGNRIDVLSFERLSQRVFSQVGPVYCNYIDDTGKQMLMQRVLILLKNKLTVLAGASEVDGFCKIMTESLRELKRHNTTPEMLFNAADNVSGTLKLKLADFALIFQEYNKQFIYPSADEDDNLTLLLGKIIKHDLFKNTHIVIDSFNSFSPKQLAIIEEFMLRCKSVTVSLATDSLVPSHNIADIFYASKITANKLFDIALKNSVLTFPNIFSGECKKYLNNKELLHLEKNYFKYPAVSYEEQTKNISIFTAKNYTGEVEALARNILRLCREENYRFRDIAVITKAMDTYAPLIRHIFSEFEILFHLDEKFHAMQHSLTHDVLSLFEIVIRNYSYDAVFTWLKSEYCGACEEDIFLLENYVLACGNTPKMWKSSDDWTFIPRGFDSEKLLKINEIKNIVRAPLISFSDKFKGRKTVAEISAAFSEFLFESGSAEIVENKINYYRQNGLVQKSNMLSSVWNGVISTLDSIVSALGDQYITFEKYYSILTAGLKGCEIGQIPPTVDEVLVCSVDRFKSQETKCVFIIGATNGVFPACYTNEGLLSDSDRNVLADNGIELADDSVTKQAGENFVIYSAITSPLDKLYLFYPIADNDGGALYPSTIIERFKGIFPDISRDDNIFDKDDITPYIEGITPSFNKMISDRDKFKQVQAWFAKKQPERLNHALSALKYTNLPHKLTRDAVSLLYGNTPSGSVSRAEQFNRCQYAHFLRYGLRAAEREKHNIQPTDAGTFMHDIIEQYSNYAEKAGWQSITKEDCTGRIDEITQSVLEKYVSDIYTSSSRFNYLSKKVKRIMSTTAWNITEFYKKTSFVPLGYELSFENGGTFPPIEIDVGGEKIMLRGKVDRADIWRTENGNYVSIVDYKSSSKNINYSEILCGIQIQLPTYIKAVCDTLSKKEGVKTMPAAMLYYTFDAPVISADRNISDEEIWENVQKHLKMQGLMLEGDKIAEGINSVFAVKSLATSDQIDRVCGTAYKKLKSAFSGILDGSININPARVSGKTACEWCPYGSVCRFDTSFSDNKYRNVKKINSREEFFEHVSEMD